jgi:HPt (histidine-containing phosphotransfer) domain-containing protein
LKQLERFLESNDAANAQKLCLAIKGSAGGYGYPQLTTAAEELRKLAATGARMPQVKPRLDVLKSLCASASMVRDQEESV